MINNISTTEQFAVIGQVFLKIAINFWPALVIGIVAVAVLAIQEKSSN